jgi:hypothetical protein
MRTTVSISEELLAAAKARARATGTTLGSVLEQALRRELATEESPTDRPAVPVFDAGTGPRPGRELTSNAALHEALDDAQPLDQRR